MSRKNRKLQQQLPVDTGGLNLSLPPQTPPEEPALDVLAAPSNAHKAVEELETLPPQQTIEPRATVVPFDKGAMLTEALHMSGLWLAVRRTNVSDVYIISNGSRFWTVDTTKLEPLSATGVESTDGFRYAGVWRPVAGNERGWYVG